MTIAAGEQSQAGEATASEWRETDSEVFHDDDFVELARVTYAHKDGRTRQVIIAKKPPSVMVLPITPEGKVMLTKQHRRGSGKETLELPGGMIDEGIDPTTQASQELEEETGYRPQTLLPFGRFHYNPSATDHTTHIFLAEDLVEGTAHPEDLANIEIVEKSLDEVIAALQTGEITEPITAATLGRYALWQSLEGPVAEPNS